MSKSYIFANEEETLKHLRSRRESIVNLLDTLNNRLDKYPNGTLRLDKKRGVIQYYHLTHKHDSNGVYIPRKDDALAARLAQKDYDLKLIRALDTQLKAIDRFLKDFDPNAATDVYEKLSDPRKMLVMPAILSDDEFIEQWQSEFYEHMGFREGSPEYYTARGERVRSKSEILIADALYRFKIPYRYEYPVYQNERLIAVPDFNCLNVRTRDEYYWEHNGMMGDAEYINHTVKKMEKYAFAEDFDERKLIMTFETEQCPLDTRVIEEKIRRYLL